MVFVYRTRVSLSDTRAVLDNPTAHREADPARRGDPVLRVRDRARRRAAVQVAVQHVLWARKQPLCGHLHAKTHALLKSFHM